MYNYEIIEHVENTYSEGSEMAMSLTEIFRNDGKEEGATKALAKKTIRLITKFAAPLSRGAEEGARTRIKYGRNDY